MTFAEATRVERVDEHTFAANVPEGWQQGRGAYGGLVVGLMIRALEALEDDATRPLRALSAEIPSPVMSGPTTLRLTTFRRGSGVSSHEAHLVQDGEVRARASGLFGKARPVELAWQPEPPTITPFDSAPVVPELPSSPPFTRHFEYRLTGPFPFAGASREPVVEGWVRPRAPLARLGVAEVAALVDCYWPSFFTPAAAPRPSSTIGYALHTTPAAEHLAADAPFYYRARTLQVAAGFLYEQRELWTAEGELVALNPQTFCVIQ